MGLTEVDQEQGCSKAAGVRQAKDRAGAVLKQGKGRTVVKLQGGGRLRQGCGKTARVRRGKGTVAAAGVRQK